jgi:hypothetical protein
MGYSSRVADDYGYLVTYLTHMMDKLKVDVRLNTTVERKTVEAFAPDAVVIATGARGGINFWPMIGDPNVFDLFSALDRPDDDWEDKVVITTGESRECFLALYIANPM